MADLPDPPDLEIHDSIPAGLKVTADEPYHVLLVTDLAGSGDGSVAGPLQAGVVDVTADTFDDVMAAAHPSVSFTTTDPLGSGNAMVEVKKPFIHWEMH